MMRVKISPSLYRLRLRRWSLWLGAVTLLLAAAWPLNGCRPRRPDRGPDQQGGRVVEGGGQWRDNREVLSPIILREPLYACTNVVWVSGFIPGAEVIVREGSNVIATEVGHFSLGQQFKVSINFTAGQVITAAQRFNGVTGGPSNAVTVRSHTADYPAGIPRPDIVPPPLYKCGRAISASNFVPGAVITAQAEPPLPGGGFGPPATIGSGAAAAPYPGWWMNINPAYELGARVTVRYQICSDTSTPSPPQLVADQPALPLTKPTLDPIYAGATIVTVRNILNGATLKVFNGATQVGESATPGGGPGTGQQMFISPSPTSTCTGCFTATQTLCDTSPPSDPVDVLPCSALPAAKIKLPQPGDTQVEVTDYQPGARIVILANGAEIGDGGPPIVPLTRPVAQDEEITVIQILGECRSRFVYVIRVRCPFGSDPRACAPDWPMFRHNQTRNAQQPKLSAISNPDLVKVLKVKWNFREAGVGAFRASPVVYNGRVYIGNSNGRLYALDAVTGAKLWQYPPAGQDALTSDFTCNPSSFGLASSAAIARVREVDAVIFGAPDRSLGTPRSSGRLFALNAQTGAEIWKSPAVAVLSDTLHEQIGYSSPLVLNNRVYIGIANHCDNPIQNGKVVAVNLNTGAIDGAFNYKSTNTRGGGVWSSVAGGAKGELYITTGNVASGNPGGEPSVNNALGLLRLDSTNGAVVWKFQPVPFVLDGDPDWASGATFIPTSCGELATSTMKDGWSYAVRAGTGAAGAASVLWQFPPTGFPFAPGDGTAHGDTRYLVPGAAWGDTFITMTGGETVVSALSSGFSRLHALNACAQRGDRVRWLIDVPGVTPNADYQLGPPTVSRGVVFVGTTQGRLIAFADPAVYPAAGVRCSNPSVSNANCVANGFKLVPQPTVLANIDLSSGAMHRTEPALAQGRVYVATEGGRVLMLAP